MIETETSITIDADIARVWDHAKDIGNWANLMPGMQQCNVIDADNSEWVLKVGVGGLVRTVKVRVHVDEWGGPERARFSYKLEGDPVKGGGSYLATPNGPRTDIVLHVRVEGGGPMAPMWEAMGRPLLPQLAKSFAAHLKAEIEKTAGAQGPGDVACTQPESACGKIRGWLRRIREILFGKTDTKRTGECT